jgi:UDP-GlcNAc:undecaprenyl-phosphate GlcNAc-1-phosphate transferase
MDRPGERKVHAVPIPRLGGVGVILAIVLTALLALGSNLWMSASLQAWMPMLLGGAIVFGLGVWDDIRSVPTWAKFCFQALAACVAMWCGVRIEGVSLLGGSTIPLGVLTLPLTFLWIVGITNAFNLVDGLDGLAAGLAIIAAGACAGIFFLRGGTQDAQLLLIMLGALLGFLPYNFNPATIFLGDSGSLVVGFVLAITSITGSQKGATALAVVIPLLVFGLPIIDTLLSMTRRFVGSLRLLRSSRTRFKEWLLCARHMFEADQRHIHHRLLAIGLSHRNAVLYLYAMALGLSFLALLSVLAQYRNAGVILIAVGLATYIGIHKLGYDEVALLRTGTLLHWYEQLTFNRHFFLGFVDLILIGIAYWGTFLLKYDPPWTGTLTSWYRNMFPLVLVIQLSVFHAFGLYRRVWRAAEVSDLMRVALVALLAVAVSFTLVVLNLPPEGTFRFFSIDALLLGALVVGVRSTYRVLDYVQQRCHTAEGTALIYGAGREGQLVLRELLQTPRFGLRPIGFLDDDTALHGRMVNGVSVLGSLEDLKSIIDSQPVSVLILSADHLYRSRVHRAISVCQERGIPVVQGCLQLVPMDLHSMPHAVSIVQDSPDS